MQYTNFNKVLAFLRKELPFSYPIKIKRTKMPVGIDGDCCFKNNIFLIRIEKNLPENYAIDIMLHEMSHALSWGDKPEMHDNEWGISFSIVYRKFLEWLDENQK